MAAISSFYLNILSSFPVLVDNNYQSWKDGMTIWLRSVGATHLLVAELDKATVPAEKKDLDDQLPIIIWSKIHEKLRYIYDQKALTSGLTTWKTVEKIHHPVFDSGCRSEPLPSPCKTSPKCLGGVHRVHIRQ